MMEDSMEDGPLPDDSDYWDNIVEELLDIDPNTSERKNSNVSIVLPVDDQHLSLGGPSGQENSATDPDSNGEEEMDGNLLAVEHVYIFEDGDSEILLSEGEGCEVEEGIPEESAESATQGEHSPSDDVDVLNQTQNFSDEYKQYIPTLCQHIRNQDMEGVEEFITEHEEDIGAICLVSDDSGTTAVTAAAALGYLDILEKLSGAGVWLYCYDAEGYMAIHRAAENGHDNVVHWLSEQGQWTASSKDGLTALHVSARCGQFSVINILLDYMKNIDEETVSGLTPLHMAVLNGHVNIVELLIGKGANINYLTSEGKSALHLAAEAGEVGIVDVLNCYGCDIDCVIPGSLKTPLHLAVEKNHDQVVCKLLDFGANVDLPDSSGDSVLHKLHTSGLPSDCVAYICRKSSNIDLRNRKGRPALFQAIESGNIYVSCILIDNGANPNFDIDMGCSPLYAATHHGHWEIVEKLILAGAKVNKQTINGSTALYKASRNGLYHIVALLICSGANTDLSRKTGWTPLHVAIHHGHTTIVDQLVASGANVNFPDNQGQTPLAIAAYCKNSSIVKILKKQAEDPVSIYNAAKLGNCEILTFLEKCGFNLQVTNSLCGWQAIHQAALEGNNKAVTALANAKVDLNCQDHDGNTPLHLAIFHRRIKAVQALLHHHCFSSMINKKGETSLTLAVQTGSSSVLQALLRHGAFLDEPDNNGKRPLIHAIERGHKNLARMLVHHGATVNAYDDNHTQSTPVRLVCQYGDSELLKVMANQGASIEQRDNHNNTLLHTAAQYGHLDVVLELITMRCSLVNAENTYKKKPLHLAASEGHPYIVEALLSAGTKVTIMDADDTVNYEMAKHKEVWEVLKHWASAKPSMLVPASRTAGSGSPGAGSQSSSQQTFWSSIF